MSPLNFTHILTQAVDELSESESYKGLFHQHTDGNPLPSAKVLRDIIELARAIIFPGYFGNSTVNSRTVTYHIGVNVERLFDLLQRSYIESRYNPDFEITKTDIEALVPKVERLRDIVEKICREQIAFYGHQIKK